ncbi:MAG: class I SAM-dependent methyltransferase [Actinomycetes bacterium]
MIFLKRRYRSRYGSSDPIPLLRYEDDRSETGTRALVAQMIPTKSVVLDVGCASGHLGRRLASASCELWGVDRDAKALDAVTPGTYVRVALVDLNNLEREWPFDGVRFQRIVAADVLEHLVDPKSTLMFLGQQLENNGMVIVSLPNVANITIRIGLLLGKFERTETGILDSTHLHFYTFHTARQLMYKSGFHIVAELSGSRRFGRVANHPLGRLLRGLLAYNIVLVGRLSRPSEVTQCHLA